MKKVFKTLLSLCLCASFLFSPALKSEAAETALLLNSEDNTEEILSRSRMISRLYIPDLGINVAVFDLDDEPTSVKQEYIDLEDTAVQYVKLTGDVLICDHSDQGFETIKDAVPFETTAFIQKGTALESYICIYTGTCRNIDGTYTNEETGLSIYEMDYGYDAAFFTVTCVPYGNGLRYYCAWFYCGEMET